MRRFRNWRSGTGCIRTSYAWKKQVLDNAAILFARGASGSGDGEDERERETAELDAGLRTIG